MLVINQVQILCEERNPSLKKYQDSMWGEMEHFDTFNVYMIPQL